MLSAFEIVEIESIEKKNNPSGIAYDLEVEDDHSYNVDDIIVHNSVCSTRAVAGCGVPQLAAIAAISLTLKNVGGFDDVTLIADGGIRTTGDVIKALAVGADAVMIGRLFAGTDEAPLSGKYFGMASKEAGRIKENIAPEGTITSVAPQGSVSDVVASIKAGLQTAMSYQDALTLEDLRQDPQFVRITMAGLAESGIRL